MATAVDRALLEAQVDLLRARYPQESFLLGDAGLVVRHVGIPSRTGDRYTLRYDFGDTFDAGPPSAIFCDPATFALGRAQDWPAGPDRLFKLPPNNGLGWICTPMTREGRAHHAEWAAIGLWEPTRPLESIVGAMREVLQLSDVPSRPVAA